MFLSLYYLMTSANISCGWKKIKVLIKSWKIKYDSGFLTIITDSERAKIEKYFQATAVRVIPSLPLKISKHVEAVLLSLPFCNWNFVKLLNKSHHIFPMSLLDPCLSQMRTWRSLSAAVIWFFMQFFCLSKVPLFWISRNESHSNVPCDGGETQMALGPHGACLRHEEHRLPCTVPHWPKSQKAAPEVLSLLYFLCWYMLGATNFHFKLVSFLILGLTLSSEENRRICCSLGKSNHQDLWIHAWDCSHGPESVPTPSRKLSTIWCSIPGVSTPSLRLQMTCLPRQQQGLAVFRSWLKSNLRAPRLPTGRCLRELWAKFDIA